MELKKECEICDGRGWYDGWDPNDDGGGGRYECEVCNGTGEVGILMGKVVAIDFDGVISHFERWKGIDDMGFDTLNARELIEELIEAGAEVYIYTTRMNTDVNKGHTIQELRERIAEYLKYHKYPRYGLHIYDKPGKPLADLYIDDRAYHHDTNATWYDDEIERVIKRLDGE